MMSNSDLEERRFNLFRKSDKNLVETYQHYNQEYLENVIGTRMDQEK